MSADSEDVIGIYRRHAKAWMDLRNQNLFEEKWLKKFLDLLPRSPLVLDIGCGFGAPIATYLSDKGCTVTGVDASPEMIEVARQRAPMASWIISDMRRLNLTTKFDGMLAWDSMFHLTPEDQRLMFPIFQRHAAPRATLLFTSGPRHGEAVGEFEGEPLYHGSLEPAEYRSLLNNHGFEVMDHIVEDPECGGHTVWLARAFDAG
jgi:SAM-dependent methyltransferase